MRVLSVCYIYESTMSRVILASQSPQRKALLTSTGISFIVIPANINEQAIQGSDQVKRAQDIARAKAEEVASKYPQGIILAADTYLIDQNQAIEKPQNLVEATEMLKRVSGRRLEVVTGIQYFDPLQKIDHQEAVLSEVIFRTLSEQEIQHYVTSLPVLTWAGAFSLAYPEAMGVVAEVKGSLSNVIGLPLEKVVPLLKVSGLLSDD